VTMHNHCPTCTCAHKPEDEWQIKIQQLDEFCRMNHFNVSPDKYVRIEVAAKMLNRSPETLRGWRYSNGPILGKKGKTGLRFSLLEIAAILLEES